MASTNSHIDPSTLHQFTASSDGIPSLGVHPAAVPVPQSNNPFTGGAPSEIDTSHTIKPSVVADDPPANITSDLKAKEAKAHSAATPSTFSTGTTGTTSTTSSKPTGTSTSSDTPLATGLRQRVNNLGTQLEHAQDHPAVQNVKGTAQKQVGQFREFLGRSKTVRSLEQRFNVDRVVLVTGAVLAYILLIPLNIFGLALPTTTLLTLVPPSFLALGVLDNEAPSEQNEAATRALLAYFVTLGFIQTLESLAAGVLERRIPQYYTLKLVVLGYLLHPQTQGAMKLHQAVFRPLFVRAKAATSPTNVNTPPQSKEAGFHASSPAYNKPSSTLGNTSGFANTTSGLANTGSVNSGSVNGGSTFASDSYGNVTKSQAQGEGFSVVTERH